MELSLKSLVHLFKTARPAARDVNAFGRRVFFLWVVFFFAFTVAIESSLSFWEGRQTGKRAPTGITDVKASLRHCLRSGDASD